MQVVFPSLKKLKLSSINVEKIWLNSFSAIESWGKNLTKLTVEKCGRLKFLFSSSMVNGLEQLQRLDISHCKSMNEVINTRVGRDDNMIEMVFPKLVSLQLSHLPKLTRFGIGDSVEFPSLCQLHIACCPNLKRFICSCTEEMSSEKNIHTTQTQPLFDEKVEVSFAATSSYIFIFDLHILSLGFFSTFLPPAFCSFEFNFLTNMMNIEFFTSGRTA